MGLQIDAEIPQQRLNWKNFQNYQKYKEKGDFFL